MRKACAPSRRLWPLIAAGLLLYTGCRGPAWLRQTASTETSDAFLIEQAVYGYLLEQDFWAHRPYSAVFVKGSDREVAALIRRFPNHQPKIKPSYLAELHPNVTPIDRETGQPAIIFAATADEPTGDSARAIGTYYGGSMLKGMLNFELSRKEGRWHIDSAKLADLPDP